MSVTASTIVYVHDEKEVQEVSLQRYESLVDGSYFFTLRFSPRLEISFLTPLALHAFLAMLQDQIQAMDQRDEARRDEAIKHDEVSQIQ